jgi:predicted nucleic acid-binding protein
LNGDVLVDTGPIVAILSQKDQYHETCVEQLRRIRGRLLTCWPVITEAAWLLRKHPVAVERLLAAFGGQPFGLSSLNEIDLPPIAAILAKYKPLRIQLADAAILHLANRDGIDTVLSLDRRDFEVVRKANGARLKLIP